MNLTRERVYQCLVNNPNIFDGLNTEARVKFMAWIPDNIHVISAFGLNARILKDKGNREYYSAYAIREKLRWDSMVSENGTEFKISNDVTPFVSRLIMAIDPKLKGMFRTKDSESFYDGGLL